MEDNKEEDNDDKRYNNSIIIVIGIIVGAAAGGITITESLHFSTRSGQYVCVNMYRERKYAHCLVLDSYSSDADSSPLQVQHLHTRSN